MVGQRGGTVSVLNRKSIEMIFQKSTVCHFRSTKDEITL